MAERLTFGQTPRLRVETRLLFSSNCK